MPYINRYEKIFKKYYLKIFTQEAERMQVSQSPQLLLHVLHAYNSQVWPAEAESRQLI